LALGGALLAAIHRPKSEVSVLGVALVLGSAARFSVGQTTIASKQSHDFRISLASKSGRLVAEKDEYCAFFNRTTDEELTQVEDVFLNFAQQVGRMRETPRKFLLSQTIREDTAGMWSSASNAVNKSPTMSTFTTPIV
jgi:hypothetical protein